MDFVRVAVKCSDGSLGVLTFYTRGSRTPKLPYGAVWEDKKTGTWTREPSQVNIFAEVSKTYANPSYGDVRPLSFRVLDPEHLPTQRLYRDAWVDESGGQITHDMVKARAIHLDEVRLARAPQLDQLDRDLLRAWDQADDAEVARVRAVKQELRDITVTLKVEDAQTVEELKTRWSPLLGTEPVRAEATAPAAAIGSDRLGRR